LPGTSLEHSLRKLGFFGTPATWSFSFEAVKLDPRLDAEALRSMLDWHVAGGDSDVI
jgi:hypothetical protein